ncbi:MAG: 50S ribosomal protein L9 [Deltaproteobacteria bacterium]|nr:50S ribosomal protein L9 [Deltaproteobacteria bacterium]MCB9788071.1 50S ribosomal protein L9 [Deltaproteobacteria bacterium]
MQVILKQDVPYLGDAGALVEVKSGYGANYLIPQGLAVLATRRNKSQLDHERRAIEAAIVRQKRKASDLASRLNGLSVTLTRLVGEDDKIFGSVTTKDIADALADDGVVVDRRHILLDGPLKALGVYEVDIKLHRDVRAQIKVWVVAD